jgi:hypothetical protein
MWGWRAFDIDQCIGPTEVYSADRQSPGANAATWERSDLSASRGGEEAPMMARDEAKLLKQLVLIVLIGSALLFLFWEGHEMLQHASTR